MKEAREARLVETADEEREVAGGPRAPANSGVRGRPGLDGRDSEKRRAALELRERGDG